ncbi:hypothetical protein [Nocardioides conyzicola]|uniref:WXG100 family type VII secretion target n=1 Tax=Nocardioides conyzicola TaxID=1651781 RepID=A0ABP8XBL6_9ACTN
MLDPELPYRRITSGEASAVRERGRVLRGAATTIDGACDAVQEATGIPVWTGDGATAFAVRATAVLQAAVGGRVLLAQTANVLDQVAAAYAETCTAADQSIAFWRNRTPGMPGILETLLAALVSAQLAEIGKGYDAQLAAATAVLTGETDGLDLDALDGDTRAWVERGLDKTEDWLDEYGSTNGPLIPNTQATGDGRGLTPQGLGYDPASGMLLQTYYKEGQPSVLSVIDPRTGQEVNEVVLTAGRNVDEPLGHAGGVTVDGDNVHVSSGNSVYTYSMDSITGASAGTPIDPTSTQGLGEDADGDPVNASYTSFHDGKLYVGDFDDNTLRVYEKGSDGSWVPGSPPAYTTPPLTQGVVVRDDGFIYSTSEGRTNSSTMIVQHGHGDYDEGSASSYEFPNMAEGIVEVDGQLVATYESGSDEYQHAKASALLDRLFGGNDDDELWASPFMTQTPLSALGLATEGAAGELEAEPESLTKAAAALGDPASTLKKQAGIVEGVTVPAHLLGDVPSAGGFSSAVTGRVDPVGQSTRTSAAGVELLADALEAASHHYVATDDHVSAGMRRLSGRLG